MSTYPTSGRHSYMAIPPPAAAPAISAALPMPEEAERRLAELVRPLAVVAGRPVMLGFQLVSMIVMSLAGAGLALAARPGPGGPYVAAFCGLVIVVRSAASAVAVLQRRTMTGWTEAAEVHARSLPGRVPPATLAAAARHLPVLAVAGRTRAWLYIAPCQGDRTCTVLCESAAVWRPGEQVMVILGQHPAENPQAAAAALAHETGHQASPGSFILKAARHVRVSAGWGYSAAALAGMLAAGWPGVLAAVLAFHLVSLLVMWGGEVACDLRSIRTEGVPAAQAGFTYMESRIHARRDGAPRAR